MKFKLARKITALALASILVLSGCSNNKNADSTNNNNSGDTPTTNNATGSNAETPVVENTGDSGNSDPAEENASISGSVTVYGGTWSESYYESLIAEFNKYYPDITVTPKLVDGMEEEALTILAATNDLPDVIPAAGPLKLYLSQGWVAPLNEFFDKDPDKQYIEPILYKNMTYRDTIYGLPRNMGFFAVLVNLDLIDALNEDAPPLDWTVDDFVRLAKKATTDTLSGYENFNDFMSLYTSIFETSGRPNLGGYDTVKQTYDYTSGAFIKAVNLRKELEAVPGLIASTLRNSELTDQGLEDAYQKKFGKDADAMRENKVLMRMFPTWDLWWATTLSYNYGIYPQPRSSEDSQQQMFIANDAIFLSSTCKDKEAAYELLRFMSISTEGNLYLMDYYANLPDGEGKTNTQLFIPLSSHPDVVETFKAYDYIPNGIKYIYENLGVGGVSIDHGKYTPGCSEADKINEQLRNDIEAGTVDASSVVAEMEKKANDEWKAANDAFYEKLK